MEPASRRLERGHDGRQDAGPTDANCEVFTIGHSNHRLEKFLGLLKEHGIEVFVDVRSHPASKYAPHFNKAGIRDAAAGRGVKYLFLGGELGGRPADAADGTVGGASRTSRLSVDEAGFILETTYDESGEVVDEDVLAAVADLPVAEEYVDDRGRLVSVAKDELGNTFEQIMDEDFNTLETRLLLSAD